jgi:hypothetical protein
VRGGHWWRSAGPAAVAFVVAGLSLVAGSAASASPRTDAAPGANSQTFVDPTGDQQGTAPDLATVQIDNDDAGSITFRITLANRPTLGDGDFVVLYLVSDLDTRTGCGEGVGAEFFMSARGLPGTDPPRFTFLRCVNGTFDIQTPEGSFTGSFDGPTQTLVFRINWKDLRYPKAFQFAVVGSSNNTFFDFGGTPERWIYEVIAPPPPPDLTPPTVRAVASKGVHGKAADLLYRVSDDNGMTREEIKVYGKRNRVLWTKRTRMQPSEPGRGYKVSWSVPRSVKGRLRFCARAWDEAGNRSSLSCAALTIR